MDAVAEVETFDVFLSYSRADAEPVRRIQARLREAGLATFLDRDRLPAGQPWLPAARAGHRALPRVAVLVGPDGLGHLAAARGPARPRPAGRSRTSPRHSRSSRSSCPGSTIPPGGFLRLQTWVDLRRDLDDPAPAPAAARRHPRARPLAEGATLSRGVLPLPRPAAVPRGGRRPVLRPRGGGRGARRQGPRAPARDAGRPLGQRQVVGRLRRPDPGAAPARRRAHVGGPRPAARPRAAARPGAPFDPPPADLAPLPGRQAGRGGRSSILRAEADALGRRIRSLLAAPDERGTERLLLYVDQWEELYTQALRQSGATRRGQAEADVTRFIDLVLDATRTSPCTVVLTVRADFYGELLRHGPARDRRAAWPGQSRPDAAATASAAAIREPARSGRPRGRCAARRRDAGRGLRRPRQAAAARVRAQGDLAKRPGGRPPHA